MFTDQIKVLSAHDEQHIPPNASMDDMLQALEQATFSEAAHCCQHSKPCPLPRDADLCVFGAPCVDDSAIGSRRMDAGPSRRVTRLDN